MKWITPAFTSVLLELFPQYKESKGAEREDVIRDARKRIKDLAKNSGESLPTQLSDKIANWFHNHRHDDGKSSSKRDKPGKYSPKWTLRSVVKEEMGAEIQARVDEKSGGDKSLNLKYYPESWTEICNELTEEKKAEFLALAEERNQGGVPVELQRKRAKQHLAKSIQQFVKEMDEQMGAKVFMLVGYENEKGEILKAKMETPAPVSNKFGPTFQQVGEAVWQKWDRHLGKVFKDDENQDNEDDDDSCDGRQNRRGRSFDKGVPYELKVDDEKWPILPDMGHVNLAILKDIVRSFLTVTYRRTAHNKKVSVPWMVLINNPEEYIDDDYIPEDFVIKDPSKMKWDELRSLCRYWRLRQEKSLPVFRFKSVMKGHMREDDSHTRRRKDRPAYVEIDEPEGSRMAQGRAEREEAVKRAAETASDMEEMVSEGDGGNTEADDTTLESSQKKPKAAEKGKGKTLGKRKLEERVVKGKEKEKPAEKRVRISHREVMSLSGGATEGNGGKQVRAAKKTAATKRVNVVIEEVPVSKGEVRRSMRKR